MRGLRCGVSLFFVLLVERCKWVVASRLRPGLTSSLFQFPLPALSLRGRSFPVCSWSDFWDFHAFLLCSAFLAVSSGIQRRWFPLVYARPPLLTEGSHFKRVIYCLILPSLYTHNTSGVRSALEDVGSPGPCCLPTTHQLYSIPSPSVKKKWKSKWLQNAQVNEI